MVIMDKTEIFEKMKEIIEVKFTDSDLGGPYNLGNITIDSKMGEDDIGLDSLDVVEVTLMFEEEFDIEELPDEDLTKIAENGNRISDIVDLIEAHLK